MSEHFLLVHGACPGARCRARAPDLCATLVGHSMVARPAARLIDLSALAA
jgi:hypothetical protein